MVGHLRKCLPVASDAGVSKALLVRAQATRAPAFWLDCAVKTDAKMKDLDRLCSGALGLNVVVI